ncbi:MAG: hypothetical protein HMLKMBBP_01994 [Planctomycetes bacterium]|nr:hypothetical protein [Planctomycetota bacterium]
MHADGVASLTAPAGARGGIAASSLRRATAFLCAAALSSAVGTRSAAAEELLGPQIRNGGYLGHVLDGPEGADADAFRAALVRGERLDVTVATPSGSGFIGGIEILDPDGAIVPVPMRTSASGRRVRAEPLEIPRTGVWTVRVSGRFETYGRYRVSFRVRPAPDVVLELPADPGGGAPAATPLAFDALDGSRLDFTASVKGRVDPPTLAALLDPAGADVPGESGPAAAEAVRTARGFRLRADLSSGDGTYAATVQPPEAHEGVVLRAALRRPPLARGVKRLGEREPYVAPRATLLRGATGLRARITGERFDTSPPPAVWFGDTLALEVQVDEFGSRLDVIPPELPEGSLVRIGVVNRDGQSHERPDYFFYVPEPVFTELTDADGAPARGASTEGGRVLFVEGAHFETGLLVRFSGTPVVLPQIRSPELMEIVAPAHAPGLVRISFEDAYLHDVDFGIDFEFKTPPSPQSAAFLPPAASSILPTVIAMSGSGYELDDVVLVNGAEVPSVWFSASNLTFTVPPGAPGALRIEVRDRVGTVVRAPDLARL